MNQHPVESSRSAYYPPRARWFSRMWYPWNHLRQISFLRRIPPLSDLSSRQFLLSCLVPGYVLRFYHFKRTSNAVVAGYFVLLLLFFITFGHLAANLAFGLMISAHATCLGLVLQRWLQPEGLRSRVAFSVLSLLIVGAFVYLPLREGMLARFLPLDTGHGVVLVRREAAPRSVGRGQMVVFEMEEGSLGSGVYRRAGYGIERVLAVAGDRVEFTREGFRVNGELHPALPEMPTKGETVVPENHFFVWPRFAITGRILPADVVAGGILRTSMIARDQIIGRPCQRWFGIRQPVP